MTDTVRAAQNVSRMCIVCGTQNESGLHARFFELDNGELAGVFTPREEHQGYPGRLHGGIASTILDEAIGRAINISDADAWGVTIELTVRYRKPVPLGHEITARARITKDSGRIFEGSGEIRLDDGTVAVEATGRYLRLPIDRIAEGDFEEEWFPDDRPLPPGVE
ncbi:MAG: Thioesterase superfamily protein [Actinobacteria bacterium 66_15]|nr:MAG: Thioesterase superfamily protein [Actinobacteria bacterium 66_15]